jgi:hypothetical protein
MATLLASHRAAAVASPSSAIALALVNFPSVLADWRARRALRRLDARQRCDVGLAPVDGLSVAVQPGWDVRLAGLR